jgi:cytochrome P450
MIGKYAPGPKRGFSPITLVRMGWDTLSFFKELSEKHGDVVHLRIGTRDVVMINDPDVIREILNGELGAFNKGRGLEITKHLLAEGLLTSEGELHRRQRRLLQPAFHNDRIAGYANIVTQCSAQTQASWQHDQIRDIAEDMAQLTLRIVGKTLFGADFENEAREIRVALTKAITLLKWMMLPVPGELINSFPPFRHSFEAARKRLDHTVYRLISARRADSCSRHDVLSVLLENQDTNGDHMSTAQIRDEVLTLMMAGHETTANALTWAWYLLAKNGDAAAEFRKELDSVLDGRLPTFADLPALKYTKWVLAESLRLCPPAWAIGRRALSDFKVGNYLVPAGATVMLCQFLVHRDARYFPEPDRFYPQRWSEPSHPSRPKFAFFPFGGGQRGCIGESFAWMEGMLILATLASNWRLALVNGQRVKMQPLITLRPKNGMKMIVRKRRPEVNSASA